MNGNRLKKIIETVLFASRWVLPVTYLVLFGALVVYVIFDVREFIEFIQHIFEKKKIVEASSALGMSSLENAEMNKEAAMLTFIELIDMTMIANLGKMMITGSYHSFVAKDHGYKNENMSSGMLKVKMTTSLVGVTSISLLSKSIDVDLVAWDTLYKLLVIHGAFLLGSIILEVIDYLHVKSELYEDQHEEAEEKRIHETFHNEKKLYEELKLKFDNVEIGKIEEHQPVVHGGHVLA